MTLRDVAEDVVVVVVVVVVVAVVVVVLIIVIVVVVAVLLYYFTIIQLRRCYSRIIGRSILIDRHRGVDDFFGQSLHDEREG